MSIGLCVAYRDPSREDRYWPYLTQRHLRDCLWPLATVLGLQRVELLEVIYDYQSAEKVRELLTELEAVCRFFNDPTTTKDQYPEWEHVQTRTVELVQRLQQILTMWDSVQEVSFF